MPLVPNQPGFALRNILSRNVPQTDLHFSQPATCPHLFPLAWATFTLPLTFVLVYVSPTIHSTIRRCKLPLWPEQKGRSSLWQNGSQYCGNPLWDKRRPLTQQCQTVMGGLYPANHQMNLHALLLDCCGVRSAGLDCNVNPMNHVVFVLWDETKKYECIHTHFRTLVIQFSLFVSASIPYRDRFVAVAC